jgi:amino acid adenylation domain-containing protein
VVTDSLRAEIAGRKRELLECLRVNAPADTYSLPPIRRRVSSSPAPLSFAQERLWFLEQLEPGNTAYNICRASHIGGALSVTALEASLNAIMRCHEVLRSVIRVADVQPVQVAEPPYELKLCVIDLQSMSDVAREDEIRRRIQQAAEMPFDFAAGKFLRGELLRLGNDEHILILTTHHIVSDAWSMGILTRELWSVYDAYANDRPLPLQDLTIQYADFAVWQRNWLQGEVLDSLHSYWKKQLNDLPIFNLPTDRIRPARQSFHGARVQITLAESLSAAINELSAQGSVTPFMTLLAAFQVLLYRYSGQEDIVVGSPIANRRRFELEPLIGFFVNTLVLRTDFSGNPTFSEILSRVRDVCLNAYSHQDLPFEKLVEKLKPERDTSRNPLFQVMFVLQNATRAFGGIPGLRINPIEIETTRSPFDVSLFLRERDGKYFGYFEYSTDLFDASTIERMAGHYQTLLQAAVANPDQSLATIPILTEAERQQILVEWNDTAADYPKDKCIHELFEDQVARTPDAIAVIFDRHRLTYRELNTRANQLAHYLRELGVGPEVLVGICVERSLEMVIGLLGILKAGGAYVPLDPAYPKERLGFMLEDAQISVLLTQRRIVGKGRRQVATGNYSPLDSDYQQKVVCLDTDWAVVECRSGEKPKCKLDGKSLAYAIYTSGSTGKPKAVLVEHRAVINSLLSIGRKVELCPKDKLLAVTTISFDIAALEIFLPLFLGARLILASGDEIEDGSRLRRKLATSKATIMQATPVTWKLLLDGQWKGKKNFKILCGGDVLSPALAQKLRERGTLWNLYGPTETTIWSTAFRVDFNSNPIPIGRPLCNTRVHILDSHRQLVPVGIPGELYISGIGVARGYLKRAEQTKERFVSSCLQGNSNYNLYRTGDLVRYLPDGNIEFLGRVDDQVKIRGYRIELGEIEFVLNQHPSVKESLVLATHDTSPISKQLMAHIVGRHPVTPSVTELRRFLLQKLPEQMVPSIFLWIDALPLTPNRKLDRKILGPLHRGRHEVSQPFVEPRSEIEELIAQDWREVLTLEKIGIYDNFFEIGGHSLSAMAVISRLKKIFQKDISLGEFLNTPTIAGLATVIEGNHRTRVNAALPPIVQVSRDRDFPLSMSQRQLWLMDRLFPGTYFQNMPYGYRLNGAVDTAALQKSLQEIVRRHEAFHMVFGERRGRPIQVVGQIPKLNLRTTDLRYLPEEERESRFLKLSSDDASLPFDLEKGTLLRAQLVSLAERDHILLITVHHIISDDWSMQIFRRELMTLYEAFSTGRPSPLPEPKIQFVDFVVWQTNAMKSRLFKAQVTYWRNQLRGQGKASRSVSHEIPRKELSFASATQPIEIDSAIVFDMKDFAGREQCTCFMVLFAVLSLLLHLHTGQSDIRVGTTVANRRHRETEDLIGNCLNAVVLRSQIDSNWSVRHFVKRIRQVCIESLTNQDVPFGQVVRVLGRDPKTKGQSQTDVMFIYQKRDFETATVSGITFAPWGGSYRRPDQDVLLSGLGLIVELRDASTKLTGAVTYKTGLGEDELAFQIASNFEKVLAAVIHNTDERIEKGLELFRCPSGHVTG